VPGLSDNIESLKKIKILDLTSFVGSPVKNESVSLYDVKMSCILSEEKYRQKLVGYDDFLLKESVVLTALSAWYAFAKVVVTSVGLLVFLLESSAKISELLGLDKAKDVLEKLAHFFEKIEDWFLTKAIFPSPVQYAAYLAISGAKKVVGKKDKDDMLSYEEFNSPEHKDVKEKVVKGLKIALLCVVVAEALVHMAHAIEQLFEHVFTSTKDLTHAGAHAGVETKNVARLGGELAKAGQETAKSAKTIAGAAGSVEGG